MKYIVIGGVAGGATAAARIRRNERNEAEIYFCSRRENTFRMPIVVYLII